MLLVALLNTHLMKYRTTFQFWFQILCQNTVLKNLKVCIWFQFRLLGLGITPDILTADLVAEIG